MVRKQVYIAPQQQKALKRLARQTGKTEAEIVREALDQHATFLKEKEERMAAWRKIEASIERRAKLRVANPGRSWKREDLYDRDQRSRSHRH